MSDLDAMINEVRRLREVCDTAEKLLSKMQSESVNQEPIKAPITRPACAESIVVGRDVTICERHKFASYLRACPYCEEGK